VRVFNFIKILLLVFELFHPEGRRNRRTDRQTWKDKTSSRCSLFYEQA